MPLISKSHLAAAVVGGVIVAGGFLVVGVTHDKTETIVDEAPVSPAAADPVGGLTTQQIYMRDAPAVLLVRADVVAPASTAFTAPVPGTGVLTGSGFLVDRQGDVLTAYHVIDGADRSDGVTVQFSGDIVRRAEVAAVDPTDDLAVLRVNMHGVPPVRPLPLGDSSSVRVGDGTLAMGDPFGDDRTMTSGIVSALQHQIQAADGQTIDNVIQTDQPLEPGDAGGPLLDAGQVVGVESEVAAAGLAQRVAIAIPIDTADTVLSKVNHAPLRLAYIGLSAPTTASPVKGAVVGAVAKGGPADLIGLRPGDVIEKVDDTPVDSIADVLAIVSTRSPGQTLTLQIRRGRGHRTLTVTLGSRSVPSPPG